MTDTFTYSSFAAAGIYIVGIVIGAIWFIFSAAASVAKRTERKPKIKATIYGLLVFWSIAALAVFFAIVFHNPVVGGG